MRGQSSHMFYKQYLYLYIFGALNLELAARCGRVTNCFTSSPQCCLPLPSGCIACVKWFFSLPRQVAVPPQ